MLRSVLDLRQKQRQFLQGMPMLGSGVLCQANKTGTGVLQQAP